ncbi:MAG TPA: VanZ family protein [Gemmatimonadaceae bacterium]|nr:VanZ family protein [Gemmatimonadaceae bacterium]
MTSRRWVPPVVWAAFILILTSLPGADLPRVGVPDADKLVHFTMYGIFAWLSTRSFARPGRLARVVVLVVLGVSLFGAMDEWHQQFIPGRSMELLDWMADTLGALAGASVALTALRRRSSLRREIDA